MAFEVETTEKAILETIALPPRPKVLIAINEETRKDNVSFAVIAQAILEDVSISSAALQIVNSPAFRRPTVISSIDQALNLLGLKRVLAIVNAVSLRKAMKTKVDLEEFWQFGTMVANNCVLLAQRCRKTQLIDDAYTIGLFHDAGVPIMMSKFPNYYTFYNAAEEEGWILSSEKEKINFGARHTTLGALMAQNWGLPDQIVEAVRHLHNAKELFSTGPFTSSSLGLLAILKCARELARNQVYNKFNNAEWELVKDSVLHYLDLDEKTFAQTSEELANLIKG
jgi:HD-like signal output (HDOD) protein